LSVFNNSPSTNMKDISYLQFKNDYLEQGKVEKVVIVNKELAEVYLTPAASEKNSKPKPGFALSNQESPDFSFNIGSYDVFDRNFQDVMKDFKEEGKAEVPVILESRSNFF